MSLVEQFNPAAGSRLQILDEIGRPVRPDLLSGFSSEDLRRMYERMVLTRQADRKALNLQRQGRLGTYPSSLGHEASQVGTAWFLQREDWIFPYFRDLGLYVQAGYPLATFFHYWMGNEAGLATPADLHLFPLAITVGAQIPQAAGAAFAARLQNKPLAVLTTFGDGATSEGDFHEGLNLAGVFRAPAVFVCYNNQWAISTPRTRQTASRTIAEKASAYGFPGIAVDGNDVLAVAAAVGEALARARAGEGPTLVESVTYRLGHHTTSDDAARYRDPAELLDWEKKDPLVRFRAFLNGRGLWDDAAEKILIERTAEEVEKAVALAESRPAASLEDIFAFTYRESPPELNSQLAALRTALAREAGR
ncbi:MAG: pyruvate dehydrogenase (acetyl-transferring) E1 component subunit alpha [Candidatus Aminicenantales bacterium]